ncbi:MAG: prenyltransferase/squalene oxidase repeat-containing protein [Candidatus Thorarchaeota archaeon]|jgi:squalene cyclase
MNEANANHFYDLQDYILEHGNIADVLRLISAGYKIDDDVVNVTLEEVEDILNNDGGVPFGLEEGNPSSVKETSELLPLLLKFRKTHDHIIQRMVQFLISRQKGDGGFAETLNLDHLIEDRYGSKWGSEFYPVGKSVTWLTGKALEALSLAKYDDIERLRRAQDFLVYSQYEDGNWPDFMEMGQSDTLATGNILTGLRAAGIDSGKRVYKDARAALFQHLKDALESKSTGDMVDLTAVCPPENDKEKNVILGGLELILETQNKDGGWALAGSKKSDTELSSILGFVLKKCGKYK